MTSREIRAAIEKRRSIKAEASAERWRQSWPKLSPHDLIRYLAVPDENLIEALSRPYEAR